MPVERTRKRAGTSSAYHFTEPPSPTCLTASSSASTLTAPSHAQFAFAPTVTPVTFIDPIAATAQIEAVASSSSSQAVLFPEAPSTPVEDSSMSAFEFYDPNATPSTPKKKTKKKKGTDEDGEAKIPRPPNAFILFRSSFIKSRHVTTTIEANSSTLSKIIGFTWASLPAEERGQWHNRAQMAMEEHKRKYPGYQFQPNQKADAMAPAADGPVAGPSTLASTSTATTKRTPGPRKTKEKRKLREIVPKDSARCQKIAELLVDGMKGEELEVAMQEFDRTHAPPPIQTRFEVPLTARAYRRSSSAPVVAEAGEQSRFYYPAEEQPSSPKKRKSDHHRSSSEGLKEVKMEAGSSPTLASVQADVQHLPPVQMNFVTDMFSPDSPQTVSYTTPTTPAFNFNSFSFQPAQALEDSSAISPLTQMYPASMGPPQYIPATDVDPSMPPLVERPYDPLTDGVPSMHGSHFAPSFAPNSSLSIPHAGLPRLSINTLDKLDQWMSHGMDSNSYYNQHEEVMTPIEPSSPWDSASPWETATPPPLSAVQSTFDNMSMPSTPAEASWTWAAEQATPMPMEMPSLEMLPPPLPMQPQFQQMQQPQQMQSQFASEQSWPAFDANSFPMNASTPTTQYGYEQGYAYTPEATGSIEQNHAQMPMSIPMQSFSKMLAHAPPESQFRVDFDFNLFAAQQHQQQQQQFEQQQQQQNAHMSFTPVAYGY